MRSPQRGVLLEKRIDSQTEEREGSSREEKPVEQEETRMAWYKGAKNVSKAARCMISKKRSSGLETGK